MRRSESKQARLLKWLTKHLPQHVLTRAFYCADILQDKSLASNLHSLLGVHDEWVTKENEYRCVCAGTRHAGQYVCV